MMIASSSQLIRAGSINSASIFPTSSNTIKFLFSIRGSNSDATSSSFDSESEITYSISCVLSSECAEVPARKIRNHILNAVGQQEADYVAFANAVSPEHSRDSPHHAFKLA